MGDGLLDEWRVNTYKVTIDEKLPLHHFKMGADEFNRVKKIVEDMGLPLEDYFEIETPEQRAEREKSAFYAKDNTVGQF
jgi:hypothetical protein